GRVSPTTAQHVLDELGDRIDLVLDGGPCQVGLESTIVDLSSPIPALLRPGAVTAEQLAEYLPDLQLNPGASATHCSGRLESHYAPHALVEIVSAAEFEPRLAAYHDQPIAVVSSEKPAGRVDAVWMQMPHDPVEYAQQLYARLREIDQLKIQRALIVLPPEAGIGRAIADRVRKAAAPRPNAES